MTNKTIHKYSECHGAHCRCMNLECSNFHYADCESCPMEEVGKMSSTGKEQVNSLHQKSVGEEDLVEVIEIWQPTEAEGEAITSTGQKLKRIAFLVGGRPLHLEKDFVMGRRHITKEEAVKLQALNNQPE